MLVVGPIPKKDSPVNLMNYNDIEHMTFENLDNEYFRDDSFYFLRRYEASLIAIVGNYFYKIKNFFDADSSSDIEHLVDYAYLTLSIYVITPILQEYEFNLELFKGYVIQIAEARSGYPNVIKTVMRSVIGEFFIDYPTYEIKPSVLLTYSNFYIRFVFNMLTGLSYKARTMLRSGSLYKYRSKTSKIKLRYSINYDSVAIDLSVEGVSFLGEALRQFKVSTISFLIAMDMRRILDIDANHLSFIERNKNNVMHYLYYFHIPEQFENFIQGIRIPYVSDLSEKFMKISFYKVMCELMNFNFPENIDYISTSKNWIAHRVVEATALKYYYDGNVWASYTYGSIENKKLKAEQNLCIRVGANYPDLKSQLDYYIFISSAKYQKVFRSTTDKTRKTTFLQNVFGIEVSESETTYLLKRFLLTAILDSETKVVHYYNRDRSSYTAYLIIS